MNAKEQEDVIRTAAIIRSARKLRGKTQNEVANTLGVSQSFLSKLEHGYLIPSSSQWFSFCKMTEVDPVTTFETGFIDHGFSISAENPYPNSVFKIHSRYASHATTKVRVIRPIIQYYIQQLGREFFDAYCKRKEIDPDFFIVLDNQINVLFPLELLAELTKEGKTSPNVASEMLESFPSPSLHGPLHQKYSRLTNPFQLIQCFIENREMYSSNFSCKVENRDNNHLTLSLSPDPVLAQIENKDSILNDFLCRFNQALLKKVSEYTGSSNKIRIQEPQCYFHGHDQCIYEVDLEE